MSRRDLLAAAAGGLGGAAGVPAVGTTIRDAAPLAVGMRKQLFIDRRFIASSEGVALAMNPPQKLGIVLDSSDAPWELGTGGFFRVIDDGGKLKLYYGSFTKAGHSLSYAESSDGLAWTKPRLGIVSAEGSSANNILIADNAIDATIFVDEHDDPARRYKVFRSHVTSDKAVAGVYASTSADGLRFADAGRVLPMWPETGLVAHWDPRIGKYVVYTRVFVQNGQNQRRVGRIETDDLLKPWPYRPPVPGILVPSPDNLRMVLSVDERDEPCADLYTNAAHVYTEAQDAYVMFPSLFRHFLPSKEPWFRFEPGNDYGLMEVQLAVSRDGIEWSRPDHRPYVAPGLADEWDRWMCMMGSGVVRRGGSLYQYYWSTGKMHDGGMLRPEYDRAIRPRSAIGALRQRLDGFISADFAYTGGTLTTPPVVFDGVALRLNADCGAMGSATVEVRDVQGRAVKGWAHADCDEVCGNDVDAVVCWRGRADLSALRGKPIVLDIRGRATKLYAFRFAAAIHD